MSLKVMVMATPNPNAKKFIVSVDLKTSGKATFTSQEESEHVPLAWEILNIPQVTMVHFFENVLTATQDGTIDWERLEEQIEGTLYSLAPEHNPDFPDAVEKKREGMSSEMRQIEEILDRTIRPYLQGDGGDLELVSFEENTLGIRYEGACGTCPSAVTGTLYAIQNVLKDEFHPDVEVMIV